MVTATNAVESDSTKQLRRDIAVGISTAQFDNIDDTEFEVDERGWRRSYFYELQILGRVGGNVGYEISMYIL